METAVWIQPFKTIRIEQLDVDFTRSPSPSCQGYLVTFQGIDYNGNADFAQWEWDFGDGSTGFGQNVAHIYPNPDDYDVTLNVCTETVVRSITVNPQAMANAGSNEAICEDLPFDFSTSAIHPSASGYSALYWYGGQGSFDNPNALQPVYFPHISENDTTITFTLVALGMQPCDNDTSTMELTIVPGAYAYAGSDEDACFGEPYDFASSSQIPIALNYDTIYWSGGTGYFVDPNVDIPIYVPGSGEIGPVQLTLVASGNVVNCDSIDEMILNIRPDYLTDLYPEICYGDSLFAQDAWRYSSGTFYDTLQSVYFCDSVIQTNLTVYPKIDKDFLISTGDSACLEETIQFTQTGSATLTNWLWDFGDGTTSSEQNPGHTYLDPGLYAIWFYYDDDMGCNDSVSHNVRVFDLPDVDFFASQTSACAYTPIDFTGTSTSNIVLWEWDFGDGTTALGQNQTYSYGVPGSYLVTLTATDINGCSYTAIHTIYVVEPPTADFGYQVDSCHTVQFADSSSAPPGYYLVMWHWDFDDGDTSDLQNPLHSFPSGGTYNVTLTVTADSSGFLCYDTITKPVVVPNLPTIYYTFTPQPTCLGDSTYFFGATGNYITDWFWDFDDGYFSSEQYPVHLYADTGTYNVLLQITDTNLCTNTLVKEVRVTHVPDVSFTMSQTQACGDEMIYFQGQSSAPVAQWHWDFGDGSFSSLQNPQHAYVTRGNFTVTLTVTDTAGCQADSSAQIMVVPEPTADFAWTNFECQTIAFSDLSTPPAGGYNLVGWLWDFEDGTTSNAQNPLHAFPSGGTYNVSLVVTSDSPVVICVPTLPGRWYRCPMLPRYTLPGILSLQPWG
ncbi:MAG: PKD domain-containing protein [Bacteroidota bacterium]|nr:PKD domain-containing protein [Bacteroidota bacterium]